MTVAGTSHLRVKPLTSGTEAAEFTLSLTPPFVLVASSVCTEPGHGLSIGCRVIAVYN